MSGVFVKFLAIGCVLSTVVACSGGSEDDKGLKDKKAVQYDTKSCMYDLNSGDTAVSSSQMVRNIKTSYFGKQFNFANLQAVSKTSVSETIKYVNSTGATVYKSELIQTSECTRNLYADAAVMPADIQERWNSATKTKEEEDSFVLGLYLPKSDTAALPSLNNSAAIIVRENTNRWTLVHEYMHHLFMVTASEQGYDEAKNRMDLVQAAVSLQAVLDTKNITEEQMALLAVEPIKKYAASLDSLMIHFTMEEMTIEAVLKDEYAKGSLTYVPENSNWYIYSSAATATEQYNQLYNMASSVSRLLPNDKVTERAAMADIVKMISNRKIEMLSLQMKYPYFERTILDGIELARKSPRFGCSHQKQADEILKITNSINFPTRTNSL